MTPKIVYTNQETGTCLYWCPRFDQQIASQVCQQKYFRKSNKGCQFCLGKTKRKHWEEPWASLGGSQKEKHEGDEKHEEEKPEHVQDHDGGLLAVSGVDDCKDSA